MTPVQARHPVTLDDLEHLKHSEFLQLSPNGEHIAYTVTTEIGGEPELWLSETKLGSRPRKVGSGIVPVWSPNSSKIAYYSDNSGKLQLWVFDLSTSVAKQLTRLSGGIDPDLSLAPFVGWAYSAYRYSWSPDSRYLVFASRVVKWCKDHPTERCSNAFAKATRDASAPLILTRDTPPLWTLAGILGHGLGAASYKRGHLDYTSDLDTTTLLPSQMTSQLFIIAIATKRVRQLTIDGFGYFHPDWSPDGRTIACASSEGRVMGDSGVGTTNIYAIDILSRNKVQLTRGGGDKVLPSWSPDGRRIVYVGGELYGVWSAFVVPAMGGRPVNLTSSIDRSMKGATIVWSSDSRTIIINYKDGVVWPIARVDVLTGEAKPIGEPLTGVRQRVTSSRSDTIAWLETGPSSFWTIQLLPSGTSTSHLLLNLNPQVDEWSLGDQEIIRWRSHRGDELEGVLIKPVGYQEGHLYPLIVDAVPGLGNEFKGWTMGGNQALAARGYAIFWPYVRAPHVWMNPFKDEAHDRAGKGPDGVDVALDDLVSGVDELIKRGIVDSRRMCLYGFSNGGAVVNQVVTKTTIFKCAVSVAAAVSADWTTPFFLLSDDKWVTDLIGLAPWEDPTVYARLSAVYRLDKVTTPMLLAGGDNDAFFTLGEIEMYNGLRYLNKSVTLLRYPNQGHGFEGRAMKDFWERENTFYDTYIGQ